MFGGQDGDTAFGNLGNDELYGNLGSDALFGGQGDDHLFGGQGDDVLAGNMGADTMAGGLGADRFVIGQAGTGVDHVADFTAAEDRLDLSAVRAAFEAATGTELTAEHLAFIQAGAATEVQVDADGAGAGGFATVCVLDGVLAGDLDLGGNVLLHDSGTDTVV
ncbi:type I secretion C-terminal target domain-containing protein [Azospirillum sp. A39]|uniref:type I secretion C-terminal target domain-containing protein n=1 Tax=Azospirillum sp. A39 TaxID=3462279 RepID=UPI0040462E80